jgi:tetratricopeptide (TPR) repeat protein
MKRASEQFHGAGDRRSATVQAANAGFAAGQLGALVEAERLLSYALNQAHGLGIMSLAKKNLARLRFVQGDYEAAASDATAAADELDHYGHRRLESYARAYASQALLAAGDVEGAITSAERGVACADAFPGARANALASLSRACMKRGDLERGLEAALLAKGLFDQLGAIEDGETLVRVAHAEALAGAGREAEARVATTEAVRRLDMVAKNEVEPQWRAGYLRIPEIVWTVALAKSLGVEVGSLAD